MEIQVLGDNKLNKVKDEATILNLITGAKEGSFEIFIWKLIGGAKHLGQVRIESVRKLRKDFCIIPIEGQDRQVQDLMSSQGYIDLYIPESALLLRCQIKQTEAPVRYYLNLPQFVAQVERRKSIRLDVYENSEVKVCFSKSVQAPRTMTQYFMKSCVDVSSGGFSFFVSKMESKFFQPGDPIHDVDVKAGPWSAKLDSEITEIRDVEPDEFNGLTYKVWRVSCKFSQIDQISKKYIDKFILERIKDELSAINE
ncbi:MAG TPA: hypothetical protein VNJ08_03375 [Bacteriovoracaceae bacterium]|nr:hypothetical protein [Bacteriovoracaceae bacterium]